MGATAEDTQREIGRLRGDMTAALEEVEHRLRNGVRGIAHAEARISTDRARQNPTLVGVVGVVAVAAVGYGVFAVGRRLTRHQTPTQRLAHTLKETRAELGERLEQALPRGLLLKLDPADGGFVRVSDARVETPAHKKRNNNRVIKKLVWAGLLSVFMAMGSVVARRVAGGLWRAMVHEEPPTEKSKAAAS
jgi:hypothetical protein